jgi:hypothetical protein
MSRTVGAKPSRPAANRNTRELATVLSVQLPNPLLLLAGRERLSRRRISLMLLICGGFGTPPQQKRDPLGRFLAPRR